MAKTVDDRSPTAKAIAKSSEIFSISLMMIVPGLIGYWVDQKIGTGFLFTLLGLFFGMAGAAYQLIRLVSETENAGSESAVTSDEEESK